MLVLTRRFNQVIMIGDDIEITIVEIRGDQVRIGINAPKGVRVDRKEVAQRRAEQAQNERDQQGNWKDSNR